MFDIDSGKLLIVAVLALIVIGPKELPRVLRQVGQAVGKMRRMATEFQGQFMDAMKEADIADIRKELNEISSTAALDYHFDPVRDVQSELNGVMTSVASSTDAAVRSPGKNFNLPSISEPAAETSIAMAAGVAPVAELDHASVDAPALESGAQSITYPVSEHELHKAPADLNGSALPAVAVSHSKRKILVPRRRSSFNIVRGEQAASTSGEPFTVRQRVVRARPVASQDGFDA